MNRPPFAALKLSLSLVLAAVLPVSQLASVCRSTGWFSCVRESIAA